ncbi:MAG: YraN family protein [Microgenomates group bacterium]
MKFGNKNIGKIGEEIATSFLTKKGFKIIDRHVTSHWGEIDIIAKKDGNKISFIEVKTRVGENKGKPYEALTFYKIKSLRRAIDYYLLKNNLKNYKLSLDVVSIVLDKGLKVKELKFFENIDS